MWKWLQQQPLATCLSQEAFHAMIQLFLGLWGLFVCFVFKMWRPRVTSPSYRSLPIRLCRSTSPSTSAKNSFFPLSDSCVPKETPSSQHWVFSYPNLPSPLDVKRQVGRESSLSFLGFQTISPPASLYQE